MRSTPVVACLAAASLASAPRLARGQAVQAARGVAVANNQQVVDSAVAAIRRGLVATAGLARLSGQGLGIARAEDRAAAAELSVRAAAALAARADPEEFFRRYREFQAAAAIATVDDSATSVVPAPPRRGPPAARGAAGAAAIRSLPTSAIGVIASDVTFVVGVDYTTSPRADVRTVSLNTNLLGAAAGTAVGALGASALVEYFKNNVSAGVAVPVGGRSGRLTSQLGVGLGGVTAGPFTAWPVLALDQAASVEDQVPASVVGGKPDERSWSSPVLGVAVPLVRTNALAASLARRRPVPVLSVGVRLPYYYPGDATAALGALFTSKRTDFVRAGRGHFTFGVAVPLYRVTPAAKS
jgi:hypothetical protein